MVEGSKDWLRWGCAVAARVNCGGGRWQMTSLRCHGDNDLPVSCTVVRIYGVWSTEAPLRKILHWNSEMEFGTKI